MSGIYTERGTIVICLGHRQRITLSFFEGNARLRHTVAGDICDSNRFVVREQVHVDRSAAVVTLEGVS